MVTKQNYRQGDVLIVPCKSIKGEEQNHLTLAKGEATGHEHRIIEGDAHLYKFDEQIYLEVKSQIARLYHEEHHEIEIPEGIYEIKIQREYIPQSWRQVID